MPLQKLQFRPGLNREGTDYSNEGGWYDGDKIRFRSGFPEKIGGWTQLSPNQFLGVCRSIWTWADGDAGVGNTYIGIGTNLKYYIYSGGTYNDITPIVYPTTNPLAPTSLANPFSTAFSTLNGAITATATTLTLTSAASFPTTGGIILIGTEKISYTGVSGAQLTGLTRGYDGTTAATHSTLSNVGCYTVTVTDAGYNPSVGDYFLVYSGSAVTVGGIAISTGSNIQAASEYSVYGVPSGTTYTFNATTASTSAATGGGATVYVAYEYPVGLNVFSIGTGWGAGPYGRSGWGTPYSSGIGQQLRLWSNDNFGADFVIAPRGGPIYYWADSWGASTRAQSLKALANNTSPYIATNNYAITGEAATFGAGATSITVTAADAPYIYPNMYITGTNLPANTKVGPTYQTGLTTVPITTTTSGASSGTYSFSYAGDFIPRATFQVITSAIQEFVIAFGSNSYNPTDANTAFNPMMVRWSDQANPYQWVPTFENQSGEYLLTNGSYIMGARATRQEILVWTDSCLYSMQYLGAPYVWGFQVLMDNISVMSPNCMITINNVTYWMGRDRFYMYSGRVEVLPCALRQYIYADINFDQAYQIVTGSNEAFNEVWWFYVSNSSGGTTIDKYVVYNYLDRVWYYGSMNRSAWLYSGIQQYPIAADYNGRLLYHEVGTDDLSTSISQPISAYVQSSDFDIGDGHNFGFVWRILPDVNFNGSTVNQPSVTMTVKPRQNSGTPYGAADTPQVQSSQNYAALPQYTIQEFTGQVYTRLRGRQMSFRIQSDGLGVAWQLGSPRIDIRPDGRR